VAVIGIILFAAAVVVGIDVTWTNHFGVDIEAFGQTYTVSPALMFVGGVVTALVGALGLMLLHDGMERRKIRRTETRAAINERDSLAAERDRLAAERDADLRAAHDRRELATDPAGLRPAYDERAYVDETTGETTNESVDVRDGASIDDQGTHRRGILHRSHR
jgi:hypothetical protein